jgi:hypothetical protein
MNLPVDSQTVMLPYALPSDPEPNQVVDLPKGQIIGGASVLNIYHKRVLVGVLNRLIPIPNVTRMYRGERVTSSVPLQRNALIRVKALQFSFVQVTFFQNFGWIGTRSAEKQVVLSDKFYKVLAAIPVGPSGKNFHLYEQLCLCIIDQDKGTKK